MNEETISKLEILHNKIYKETEEYGRTQFVSRIVDLEHNWNELKSWLEKEYTKWEKWYNNDLDTHDRNYYREEYLCTKNNIACFQIKMQELEEGGNNDNRT